MSGFSAAWLALREPYDARARNADVFSAVAALFKHRDLMQIVDLACGTGSAVRALGPRLAARQNWRLADNDPGLLADVANMSTPTDVTVSTVALDLARDLEAALEGPVDLVSCFSAARSRFKNLARTPRGGDGRAFNLGLCDVKL